MTKSKTANYSKGFSSRFRELLKRKIYVDKNGVEKTYLGKSYRELGLIFGGVTKRAIHKWLKDDTLPGGPNLIIIKNELNTTLDYLMEGSGPISVHDNMDSADDTLLFLIKKLNENDKNKIISKIFQSILEKSTDSESVTKQAKLALLPTNKDPK